ncbi:MAG: sulfurtransferase [Thermomicrobiales bacterium]
MIFLLAAFIGFFALFSVATVGVSASTAVSVVKPVGMIQDDATPAGDGGYAHPEWLAEPAWLMEHLDDANVTVIGLTPASNFGNGHIPGAAQIDWQDLEIVDTSDPAIAAWQGEVEQILTRLGVARDDTVVIYDGGTLFAPRLWWVLHQLGHVDKRVLNGGLDAWEAAGGEIEEGEVAVEPATEPYQGTPDDSALATLDEVEAALDDPNVILVDSRTIEEYVDGHIPGAISITFTENAVADDPKVWKSAEDLRAMYEAAGVTPDTLVISYCSTGVRSATTYFTLGLIGYENVALYTGSWDEWNSHPELPTTRGRRP